MANTLDKQERTVSLWQGRPVIVLNESDGHTVHFHGVMIGPKGMQYDEALHKLDAAFAAGVKKGGEEWNYDDVLEEMKDAGFTEVLAATWDECYAPFPDAEGLTLEKGQQIWVRDNANGTWHTAKFDYTPIINDDGPNVYYLTDCPMKWCHAEDISTTDPNEKKKVVKRKKK